MVEYRLFCEKVAHEELSVLMRSWTVQYSWICVKVKI